MIIFSPNTKYTMQRLADHASNGAYFYAEITYINDDVGCSGIKRLLEKLTTRYFLDLSTRQRTYRLNKKKLPIATLIVQQDLENEDKYYLYLLITTYKSSCYNEFHGVDANKLVSKTHREKVISLKKEFADFKWTVNEITAQVDEICKFFDEREQYLFMLNAPPIVTVSKKINLELLRENHKKYAFNSKDLDYKQRSKTYSWTWRYTKNTENYLKNELFNRINKLVSQKKPSLVEQNRISVARMIQSIQVWSVFKASRSQGGKLLHFAHRFLLSKSFKTWTQVELDEPVLNYLPRLQVYADSIEEYYARRFYWGHVQQELPREEAQKGIDHVIELVSDSF